MGLWPVMRFHQPPTSADCSERRLIQYRESGIASVSATDQGCGSGYCTAEGSKTHQT